MATQNSISTHITAVARQPENVKDLRMALKTDEQMNLFVNTLSEMASDNHMLAKCTPDSIFSAALTAAKMGLSISPVLSLAYVVPYGQSAKFQIGYKGLIQLSISTGLYKRINATEVYADEIQNYNPLTTEFVFKDGFNPASERFAGGDPIGYYASFELISGFTSSVFMTRDQMDAFAKQYSQAYKNDLAKGKQNSPWSTAYTQQAKKTVLKRLLNTFGPKNNSLEMAITTDAESRLEHKPKATQVDAVHIGANTQTENIPNAEVVPDNPVNTNQQQNNGDQQQQPNY